MKRNHRWLWLATGLTVFGATFVGSSLNIIRLPVTVDVGWNLREPLRYRALQGGYRSDQQILLLFFGAASCGSSNVNWLPEIVDSAKVALLQRARAAGMSFAAMGVAVDWEVKKGMQFLQSFGEFDEISVGYNWANSIVRKYMFEEYTGLPATPQVILVQRFLHVATAEEDYVTATDIQLLLREVGTGNIKRWFDNGMPIPLLDSLRNELAAEVGTT
ncbi:MAG: hypothetical protein JSW51_00225 [Gemmatimonadota bacterium]|nr:MAG: hypothetical protein JSW51_00225 [Gemmatimonadota bacterium]